jgi:hypothetical protein
LGGFWWGKVILKLSTMTEKCLKLMKMNLIFINKKIWDSEFSGSKLI